MEKLELKQLIDLRDNHEFIFSEASIIFDHEQSIECHVCIESGNFERFQSDLNEDVDYHFRLVEAAGRVYEGRFYVSTIRAPDWLELKSNGPVICTN